LKKIGWRLVGDWLEKIGWKRLIEKDWLEIEKKIGWKRLVLRLVEDWLKIDERLVGKDWLKID